MPQSPHPLATPPARVIAVCATTAVFVFAISDPTPIFWDFHQAYYSAGKAVLDSPAALGLQIEKGVSGFVNLPIVAYLFAPFAALNSWWGSAAAFTLLGLAAIGAAWLLLVEMTALEGRVRWLLLFLFAASGPLHYSVKEGNTTHMVLLALVAGLHLLRKGKTLAAGALLAFAALIKLPLLLFGAWFVLRRNWPAALGFAVVSATAGLLSLAVFGLDLHRQWLELCVLRFSSNPVGTFNDQSIAGFLARMVENPAILRDWQPHAAAPLQRVLGSTLTGLLYVTAVLACLRSSPDRAADTSQDEPERDLEYLLVLMLAIVASPLSWTHYYTWLLMPFAFFLSPRSPFASGIAVERLAWIGIFLITPAVMFLSFSNQILETFYAKFAVSHVLIGGLIWFALIAYSRAVVTTAPPRADRSSQSVRLSAPP